MLYSIEHYYQKSIESGIESMECRLQACVFFPLHCQVKYWPEVTNYGEYIRKCYAIAKEAPIDELRDEYVSLKFRNKFTLNKLLEKVETAHMVINSKNLNNGKMGYTPITHVQEQFIQLENEIRAEFASRKTFWW